MVFFATTYTVLYNTWKYFHLSVKKVVPGTTKWEELQGYKNNLFPHHLIDI